MEYSDQVLILAVKRFREIDAWVRLLSPTRGVYTAFAFGGLKSRRRFLGCLDPLNHVQFKVRRSGYRGYHCLAEGRLLDAPRQLRNHPQRLGMAVNCLKFFEAAPVAPGSFAEAYGLMRAMLATLDAAEEPSPLFPLLFRARMTFLHGMLPACGHCAVCGQPLGQTGAVCHVEEGRVACPDCRAAASGGVHARLGGEALALLASAVEQGPEQWAACRPHPAAGREFSRAVDLLVRYHMGLAWEQGGFVRA
ncbi:MAG: recombinational DNA repair protein (RecF pathway) [Solidesulfovibrio magneticus str. Maddingley MBC34]|uniref:DNA repair protein RecO n=1 Tax=Solidesulfovibrio magneticus str. Maddingley MBC34 TaxID=1206767 RepID=K6GGL3_9BACT|nr:MAG: recombinational DNA repair protein (RecF pathway) [Solidesulfovibrio magneticus str. Maddingley MBC34]